MGFIAPIPQRRRQSPPCGCIAVPKIYPGIPVVPCGFSLGNLYVEPAVAKPGSNTKCFRYLPSAVDRSDKNMAFIAPLHLFKLLISSEPRSCEKKVSIITWSCSLGSGIIGKDMYSCILKWCSDFQSMFVHESGARCPHFAKSSVSGFYGVPG